MRFVYWVLAATIIVGCSKEEEKFDPVVEDCLGVLGGDAVEDVCGVCDGDGSSCVDCTGVLFGEAEEDVCGVCEGDGTSCLDCEGVPNGESVEDICGVCAGDGSSCAIDGYVIVEKGTFTIGSPPGEPGRQDEYETQHEVTLTRGFYIMEHEVTQGQWEALMGNNPSNFEECGENCPVNNVTFWGTLFYANALSESEGLAPCYVFDGCTGSPGEKDLECRFAALRDANGEPTDSPYECEGYRLPTEAEWEYAARAGTTTALYNGEATEANADAIAWYDGNNVATYPGAWECGMEGEEPWPCGPQPIKGKLPNGFGLYDMSGNVEEWVWDKFNAYDNMYEDAVTDPTGALRSPSRIVRGGGWGARVQDLRCAERGVFPPEFWHHAHGFRLAKTFEP